MPALGNEFMLGYKSRLRPAKQVWSSMLFYKRLYVSDKIKDPEMIKWRLRHRSGMISVYVLMLSRDCTRIDIMHSAFLQEKFYRSDPLYIIGLACDKDDAISLYADIVKEAVNKTGSTDVVSFLFHKEDFTK